LRPTLEDEINQIVGYECKSNPFFRIIQIIKLQIYLTPVFSFILNCGCGGRLGQYKYFDMAPVIEQVLNMNKI